MFPPASKEQDPRFVVRASSPVSRKSRVTGHGSRVTTPRSSQTFFRISAERGIALLIVVSTLSVIGIVAVAFAFSMYLETHATRQFAAATRARFIAEAGISHARALLDEDALGSVSDDLTEPWSDDFIGTDITVDGGSNKDARWWQVTDSNNKVVGRYAVVITDESGKANLNAVQASPEPLGPGAIDITGLLTRAGIGDSASVAEAIETYRYGVDKKPGRAGVDDDSDGAIDESDEYQSLSLQGDDRRLEALEDVVAIADLTSGELERLAQVATVYSWDANVTSDGRPRLNVNTATAEELFEVLLEAGVEDPWQAAVNMADYSDDDFEMSRMSKISQVLSVAGEGAVSVGGWQLVSGKEGDYYQSSGSGAAALTWVVPVPTGSFRIRALGIRGMKIGETMVGERVVRSADSGAYIGRFNLEGDLVISITNNEPSGGVCAFRGIELVPDVPKDEGVVVRGIEAIRFNEIMVEPTATLSAAAGFDGGITGWACSSYCSIPENETGRGTWSWATLLKPGPYYARVYGLNESNIVGKIKLGGITTTLRHGEVHPGLITVDGTGKVRLTIEKETKGQPYYFQRLVISRQPDAEYVELINLSDNDVDVGGWTIQGEATGGWQAALPGGAGVPAHGVLVAAVDLDDRQPGLSNNNMDARSTWDIPIDARAVQLEFPSGVPTSTDDWLKAEPAGGASARLTLRKGDVIVDEIEYPVPVTVGMQSFEKGDPTEVVDEDGDGLDERWYLSTISPEEDAPGYTPGETNRNKGMEEELEEFQPPVIHDPDKEVAILNRPLTNVGELAGLASGRNWKPFASSDLAKIVDRITVEGIRLETGGHLEGDEAAWHETTEGYEYSDSQSDPELPSQIGRWKWTKIPEGTYRLSVYGRSGQSGEQLAFRWKLRDESWSAWSPALFSDNQGRIIIGQLTIGSDGTPDGEFRFEAKCLSINGICHLNNIRLDPRLALVGLVNVNTAPLEVLLALPGMTNTRASRIIENRPYGNQDGAGRGIGDLLIGDTLGSSEQARLELFSGMAHLLTTRSHVFQILSLGDAMSGEDAIARQSIRTVIQR